MSRPSPRRPFRARLTGVLAAALAGLTLSLSQAQAESRRPVAAVASPDRYGAAAAAEILRAGGNAVDAAVAEAFALAVTYPEAGNLGGGGFMTLYVKGKPYFLDYREMAPGRARADMYLDAHGAVVPKLSTVGNLSVAVPGTVRGMAAAHKRFGKLSWARDLQPAIRLARNGFTVSEHLIGVRSTFSPPFQGVTNFDRYFGRMAAGRTFRQPELAATLERLARGGDEEFYTGRTADLLLAQLQRGPRAGIITKADLAAYQAKWRQPITGAWAGFEVISAPPPSSGGVALLQLLRMKEAAAAQFQGVALNSPQYIHLVAELEKRVFADRAVYMGDTDFVSVPISRLIDPAYLARRAGEIDPAKPSPTVSVAAGLEKPQTTHFSIVDKDGNAVSNTYTLNGWFGSGVVVQGAGFILNDEMDDFSSKAGTPNQLGVVGGDANAIAPFKRPLSSMSPTILTRDGKVAMVLGTPGGSRIFTSIFQVLVDVYDYGLSLEDALKTPRFHHQLLPENVIFSEPYAPFSPAEVQALTARGYSVQPQSFNGDIEAIQVINGRPRPASDPRGRGVSRTVPSLGGRPAESTGAERPFADDE